MSVIGSTVPAELEPLGVKSVANLVTDASLHLVATRDLLNDVNLVQKLTDMSAAVKLGGFVLLREDSIPDKKQLSVVEKSNLVLVAIQPDDKGVLVLLRKPLEASSLPTKVMKITSTKFDWVEELRDVLQASEKTPQRILLVSEGEETSGIIGLINCLKQEPGGTNLRYVYVIKLLHF